MYFFIPFILALYSFSPVSGHSWIDNITVVGSESTNYAPSGKVGYILGGIPDPADSATCKFLDAPLAGPACCRVQIPNNAVYPRLTALPGDTIMGKYKENGHITKPLSNDSQSGNVYWYGTSNPDDTISLHDVIQWGSGSSGGGQLLSSSPFDDAYCAEPNSTPIAIARAATAGACKSTFQLPENLKPGSTYRVYWVWNFSGQLGPEHPDHVEWYTSCMDIDIGQGSSSGGSSAGNTSTTSLRMRKDIGNQRFRRHRL